MELGTDVSSDWSFKDGDLKLVSNENNIAQSIMNRLRTVYDYFELYYIDYGSFLSHFLGWRRTDETLKYMKTEIEQTLMQDGRFENVSVELKYDDEGKVIGNIVLLYDTDSEINLNLTLNENMEIEVVDTDGS